MEAKNVTDMEQSVILLSSSDDEGEKLPELKTRKCMDGARSVQVDDEFRVLSDLTGFENLAAMMEAEAFMRRRKRKRRRRRKKMMMMNENIEFNSQDEMAADAEKRGEQAGTVKDVETTKVVETEKVLISENEMPQKLAVDGAKEEKLVDTLKDAEATKAFEAGDGVRSAVVIDLCFSSEEDEVVADLRSSRGIGEMVPAEPIVRKKKKKRRKNKKEKRNEAQIEIVDVVKEGKQPDTIKAMETTKALEPESVQITENIVPQKHIVDAAKEEKQADTFKNAEITKEFKVGEDTRSAVVIDLCLLSSDNDEVSADLSRSRGVEEMLLAEPIIDVVKGEQPDTVKAAETSKTLETESIPITELIMPQKLLEEKQVDMGKQIETMISYGTESIEIEDNIVLRKLLRRTRYFDPLESSWGICCHCGEESHTAVNCTAQKRKKPCFFCGGLEHSWKHCKQGRDCYFCKGIGHIAKDCPVKHPETNPSSKFCLRCGDSGHDMWSCNSDYSPDDVKEIQCYVCKSFGHLCCIDFPDIGTKQVACYNCGLSGHLGSECTKSQGCTKSGGNTSGARSPALCFRCGEEGHFARGCKTFAKAEKTSGNLSTPQKVPKEKKDFLGSKSAPQELYKAQKKKKSLYEERVSMVADQSRWIADGPGNSFNREGRANVWIADGPGNFFNRQARANVWISPSATAKNNQEISALSAHSHFLSPQYPNEMFNHHPASPSSQAYQSTLQTSRFGNFSSGSQAYQPTFQTSRFGNFSSG